MTFHPLHTLFSGNHAPDEILCHEKHHSVSRQAFRDRIAECAAVLQPRPEMRWLLFNDNPYHFALRLFALLHAGKQVVVPPNAQPDTIAQLFGTAFDAIANDEQLRSAHTNAPPKLRLAPLDPENAVINLYTSGSTGTPKLIRKTLSQFEAEVATLESLWGKDLDGTHIIATVPHHHIYGLLFRIFWPLSAGRPFDAVTCTYPDMLSERLSLFGETTLISSPAQLSRLPTLLPLQSLPSKPHLIFSSGGPLPAAAAADIRRHLGDAPTEIFGSTETGGIAWRKQHHDNAWTLMPGMSIDHDRTGIPWLRSPHLPNDAPWKLDDTVQFQQDGRFVLGPRLDRIVKIEEKRLSLPDMETKLGDHSWIVESVAMALQGHRQTIGIVAVLTADGQRSLSSDGRRACIERLRAHLAQSFESVLLPRQWRFVDALPLNERGKLSTTELAALFAQPPAIKNGMPPLMPDVLQIEHPSDALPTVHLSLHIPPTLTHFAGHFPDLPILPGVVQIDWAVRYARTYLKLSNDFKSVENLRFQSIILPNTRLTLEIVWNPAKSSLAFSYATDQRMFSSGRIVFGEAA